MKSLINMRAGTMMLILMFLSGTSAWADVDDYLLSVRNVSHTTNTINFDLYLLDTDIAQTFEFAALQMGLLLNSSIYAGGTLTVSYSNMGSGLDGDQQFVGSVDVVSSLQGYPGRTLIRLMPNSIPPVPPGAGSGTLISSTGNGTLLARFTITSSVPFTPNTRPGLIFCASSSVSPLYPTVLSSYINGDVTSLAVTPDDAIVDGDPLLNATLPALFNVTGTADYCEGGAGLPVGLDGSETGVTYTLYRNSTTTGTTYVGTGSAFSFGNQTEGTYTIFAANDAGSIQMDGEAVITAVINTVGPPSTTPTLCINTLMTSITHTTSGATGIGAATGLPSGVTAAWASNTITISGTPSSAGVFGYSIPLTGGCGMVSAIGTITVTANMTAGAPSSTPTLCINTPLIAITHTTTGATGIGVPVNLPAGVTATWAANTVTISGTPSSAGVFGYSIPLTGGCGTVNATGTITVTANMTAGAPSSTPTLCISTPLTAITHTTTGATGIGSTSGLPTGVTASWASNTITISGTPTVSGPFNYTIPLTGGCGSVNATGTITVTPANTITLTSVVGTNNQTVCVNTAISNITYSTNGATGASFEGLPSGVNGNWSANVVTISGTPSETGTFDYTVTLTGGCGTVAANGTLTVNICTKTLNLSSVLLEGLYDGGGTMRQAQNASGAQWPVGVADHITVELHDAANYSDIVWSVADVPLSTSGTAVIIVPSDYSGIYYVTIRHRNSLETTTSSAISFAGTSISISFATRPSVYGENLGASGDSYFVIYGADVNQDGVVDTGDMNEVDNGSTAILIGYNLPDANGDGLVDTSDMNIVDNNSTAIIMIRLPNN